MPTIAVEFVSRSTRDRVRDDEEKRRDYLAAGIKEYWVIDRFARAMTVYREGAEAASKVVAAADGAYRTPLLPGLEVPLTRLFALADVWKRPKTKKGQPQ